LVGLIQWMTMEGSRRPINDWHVIRATAMAIKQAARAQHVSRSTELTRSTTSTTFKDLQRTFNSRPSKNFKLQTFKELQTRLSNEKSTKSRKDTKSSNSRNLEFDWVDREIYNYKVLHWTRFTTTSMGPKGQRSTSILNMSKSHTHTREINTKK